MTISAVTAGAAAALLAGCGGSSSSNSGGSGGTGTSPTAAAASAAASGTAVTATEKEFSITLSMTTFAPGTYTFMVQNQGKFPHNLNVNGPGVSNQVTPIVQPGGAGQLTVTLQKGSYELWCSVDSHRDRGMDMKIQVG